MGQPRRYPSGRWLTDTGAGVTHEVLEARRRLDAASVARRRHAAFGHTNDSSIASRLLSSESTARCQRIGNVAVSYDEGLALREDFQRDLCCESATFHLNRKREIRAAIL